MSLTELLKEIKLIRKTRRKELKEIEDNMESPVRLCLKGYHRYPFIDLSAHVSRLTEIYEHMSRCGYDSYATEAAIKGELKDKRDQKQGLEGK